MKKIYFLQIFFIINLNISFAQNREDRFLLTNRSAYVETTIVKTNNHSIRVPMLIETVPSARRMIDIHSFINRILFYDKISDNLMSINPNQIKLLRFIDGYKKVRQFTGYNNGLTNKLVEINHNGKIKWYSNYTVFYGFGLSEQTKIDSYLITEDGKKITFGFFNTRKILKEATISKPELIPFIDSFKKNSDEKAILSVLEAYDRL